MVEPKNKSAFKLSFIESNQSEEFKVNVCMPYFKDIYKDLQDRSDNRDKGINKVSMLNYC